MKILNLYVGIGGNRKLWDKEHTNLDLEIIAIENNEKIAKIYQDFFPQDKVIITDAHQYLLEHFKEFDFIWSSPPCPSHSHIRKELGVEVRGQCEPIYPDMRLYEEIILLKYFCKTKFVVENVVSYYPPLIVPQEIHRHYFWANFHISNFECGVDRIRQRNIYGNTSVYGVDISKYKIGQRKDQILRNMVNPYLALHILNESKKNIYQELFK